MIIHKKCTGLYQSEFLFNKVSKDTVWECIDCKSKKFPLLNLTNHEIQNISFNSIFNCKCKTTVFDPNGPTYILIYDSVNTSDKPEYDDVDLTEKSTAKIMTSINCPRNGFKKSFSIIHTNKCSLGVNLEHLELLIANLDHAFHIIGVSETWTPETNQKTQTIEMLPNSTILWY